MRNITLIMGWIQQTLASHAPKARAVGSLGFQRLPQYFSPGVLSFAKAVYVEAVPKPPLGKIGLNRFSDFENQDASGTLHILTHFFVRAEAKHDEILPLPRTSPHCPNGSFLVLEHLSPPTLTDLRAILVTETVRCEVMAYDAQASFYDIFAAVRHDKRLVKDKLRAS